MSLFGSSPPDETPTMAASSFGRSRSSLFEDEPAMTKSTSSALFQDDDTSGAPSPWDLPTPRKQQSRADLLRTLLPASDVPESYIETFDAVVGDGGSAGRVTAGGVARTLAAGHISADQQARIMAIVAPGGSTAGGEVALGRNEFNALLALIGLAQEGEVPNLDGVDERRRSQYLSYSLVFLYRSFVPVPSISLSIHLVSAYLIYIGWRRLLAWITCNFLDSLWWIGWKLELEVGHSLPIARSTNIALVVHIQICHSRSFLALFLITSQSCPISVSLPRSRHSDL